MITYVSLAFAKITYFLVENIDLKPRLLQFYFRSLQVVCQFLN